MYIKAYFDKEWALNGKSETRSYIFSQAVGYSVPTAKAQLKGIHKKIFIYRKQICAGPLLWRAQKLRGQSRWDFHKFHLHLISCRISVFDNVIMFLREKKWVLWDETLLTRLLTTLYELEIKCLNEAFHWEWEFYPCHICFILIYMTWQVLESSETAFNLR